MSQGIRQGFPNSALTAFEERFVAEYLVDLNATAAYRRAGRNAKNASVVAYELLGRPRVADAVAAGRKRLLAKVEVDQNRVLESVNRAMLSDVRRLVGETGAFKQLHELDDETAGAIESVELEYITTYSGRGKNRRPVLVPVIKKIKMASKTEARAQAMRYLGLLQGEGNEPPDVPGFILPPGTRVSIESVRKRAVLETK